jgi:hypothetical protein
MSWSVASSSPYNVEFASCLQTPEDATSMVLNLKQLSMENDPVIVGFNEIDAYDWYISSPDDGEAAKRSSDVHTKHVTEGLSNGYDFGHFVDVYGFPPQLKTVDILNELLLFGSRNFNLKRIDETHALVVYETLLEAKCICKATLPSIKARPLSQTTNEKSLHAAKSLYSKDISRFRFPAASIVIIDYLKQALHQLPPQASMTLTKKILGNAFGVKIHTRPEQSRKLKKHQTKVTDSN